MGGHAQALLGCCSAALAPRHQGPRTDEVRLMVGRRREVPGATLSTCAGRGQSGPQWEANQDKRVTVCLLGLRCAGSPLPGPGSTPQGPGSPLAGPGSHCGLGPVVGKVLHWVRCHRLPGSLLCSVRGWLGSHCWRKVLPEGRARVHAVLSAGPTPAPQLPDTQEPALPRPPPCAALRHGGSETRSWGPWDPRRRHRGGRSAARPRDPASQASRTLAETGRLGGKLRAQEPGPGS